MIEKYLSVKLKSYLSSIKSTMVSLPVGLQIILCKLVH